MTPSAVSPQRPPSATPSPTRDGKYDEETGLYFYRARYYDPKLGRFLNVDPIGFDGGDTNLYAYVGNNPINYSDPEGLAVPFFFAAATYEVLKWGGAALIAMMTGKAIYETAKVIGRTETADTCKIGRYSCIATCHETPYGGVSGNQKIISATGSGLGISLEHITLTELEVIK